ncbi:SIS domain-containing protein [Candidatus Latescibacterota bacterium]
MDNTGFTGEIKEQSAALKMLTDYYGSPEGITLLGRVADVCASANRIVFTGMGTSLHSPYCIRKELETLPQGIEIRDAGELLHFGLSGINKDDAVIAVSQSGESAETKRVVKELKGKVPVVSIVNDETSFMGKHADYVLPMFAGNETSISNKTYTNTLSILMLFSTCLMKNSIEICIKQLRGTAECMGTNIEQSASDASKAAEYFNCGSDGKILHTIARGSDLVSAYQSALILKEGGGVFGEGMSAGLFRHGPFELAGEGHSAAFFMSKENEPELTMNLVKDTYGKGSKVLIVSDVVYSGGTDIMNVVIDTPYPRYFPILCAPFIEFLVHEMAKMNGLTAGVFRNVSKITDIE